MVEDHFSSAHYLTHYEGNCENMHGHNFKVQVFVKGTQLDEAGLLADFKILKKDLKSLLDTIDHRVLNDLVPFNPTSELMAKYLYENFQEKLTSATAHVSKVVVWESDKACAAYYKE